MVYPENHEHEVVNCGLLWVLSFVLRFQYVYLLHEPTHGFEKYTPAWVCETNTHAETQGKSAKPTINQVRNFMFRVARTCMRCKPVMSSRALKKFS